MNKIHQIRQINNRSPKSKHKCKLNRYWKNLVDAGTFTGCSEEGSLVLDNTDTFIKFNSFRLMKKNLERMFSHDWW